MKAIISMDDGSVAHEEGNGTWTIEVTDDNGDLVDIWQFDGSREAAIEDAREVTEDIEVVE